MLPAPPASHNGVQCSLCCFTCSGHATDHGAGGRGDRSGERTATPLPGAEHRQRARQRGDRPGTFRAQPPLQALDRDAGYRVAVVEGLGREVTDTVDAVGDMHEAFAIVAGG